MATKRGISVRLNTDLIDRLDAAAQLRGCDRTTFVATAVAHELERDDRSRRGPRSLQLGRTKPSTKAIMDGTAARSPGTASSAKLRKASGRREVETRFKR